MHHLIPEIIVKTLKVNMKTFYSFCLLALLLNFKLALAQEKIPIEHWRTHLSYLSASYLAVAENKTYCATSNGLFYYDKEDGSINTLSRLDGLNDVSISYIAFSEEYKSLFIAYANGNLDIIKKNTIKNFNLIKNAAFIGSKRINHINFYGKYVYLATDFGIAVYDPVKNKVKETIRNLAEDGSPLRIHVSTFHNDSLFLGTDEGIIAASLEANLQNFNNYKRYDETNGVPKALASSLITIDGNVYAGIPTDGLFKLTGSGWQQINLPSASSVISLSGNTGKLLISLENELLEYGTTNNSIHEITSDKIRKPRAAQYDSQGKIWIADRENGLLSNTDGSFASYTPSGPYSDNAFNIKYVDDKMYLLSGAYDQNYVPAQNTKGFSYFENGFWKSYAPETNATITKIPDFKDIVDVAYVPSEKATYFSSFGDGLLRWAGNQFQIIDDSNSPLKPLDENTQSAYVPGIAVSQENALYALNYGSETPLVKYKDGEWVSFSLLTPEAKFPSGILITHNNEKWISINPNKGGGIVVFGEGTEKERYLTSATENGSIKSNHVTCMAEDKEGFIWIGTSQGVMYFYNPRAALSERPIDAIRPIFEGSHLLSNEFITCLKVDGGNRKWIGTRNGLWLVDEDGQKLFYQFTVANSPLPSNHIKAIDINGKTGEIFVSTTNGIASFRSTATEPERGHKNVKIFPNPVRGNFNGQVGITGLSYKCQVKITDISGKLIYEMPSDGGTAVWNVRDYNGRRAATGVYLVFSSTEDGDDTFIGKIAVIE